MTARKILINAVQPEETRVAIVDNQELMDFDIEIKGRAQKKANIYKAKISRIEPSLNAVFVDYGAQRHGFLPIKEIAPEYLAKPIKSNADVRDALREGQELVIQIEKEERGSKGAAVTTYITLAGCYLVLMPNSQQAGGISRRIEGEDRRQLKATMAELNMPENMGVIARTAGLGRASEELQWDLDALTKLWGAVQEEAEKRDAPFLIYQESDVILRSVRDYLRENINSIIIDDQATYERVMHYVKQLRPDFVDRVSFYDNHIPLFTRYHVETQIEMAYEREIHLPSGGAIVIDTTEALTSIDINSARANKGSDIEETALHTNMEAAYEIARQLRLRDLGGLVVIDFIDMLNSANQRKVEDHLTKALRRDRARVQTGRISRFGLLEMSRQRLRPSLGEATSLICPRCSGHGTIRTVESLGIAIIRLIKEDAIRRETASISVQVPVQVATYLLNEKRSMIDAIEQEYKTRVLIIPNPHMETPHYQFEKSRDKAHEPKSYDTLEAPEPKAYDHHANRNSETPAIREFAIDAAPVIKKGGGFFESIGRMCSTLFGSNAGTAANTTEKRTPAKPQANIQHQSQPQSRNSNNRHSPQQRGNRSQDGRQQGSRPAKDGRQQDRRNNNRRPQQERKDTAPRQQQTPLAAKPVAPKKPKISYPKEHALKAVLERIKQLPAGNASLVESSQKSKLPAKLAYKLDTNTTTIVIEDVKKALEKLHSLKMTHIETKKKSKLAKQKKNLATEVVDV